MQEETAQKAARWWADQLRKRAVLDNGEKSEVGIKTTMLAMWIQNDHEFRPEDEVQAFETNLTTALVKSDDRDGTYFSFGVDYNPDVIFMDAAKMAGFQLGMTDLPWKTCMWIRENKVTVAEGYGAAPMEV